MEGLRNYFMTFIITAVICAVILLFFPESGKNKYVRIACGLLLLLISLKPILQIDFEKLAANLPAFTVQNDDFENVYKENLSKDISRRAEEYILDKAISLGVHPEKIRVQVDNSNEFLPVSAEVFAICTPEQKYRLGICIESDLGIATENLHWREPGGEPYEG